MKRNTSKILTLTVICLLIVFAACKKEKECDKTDPNSGCYVPPIDVPKPEKHTTTYLFDRNTMNDFNWELARKSADSNEVEWVIIESAENFEKIGSSAARVIAERLETELFSTSAKFKGIKIFNPRDINANDSVKMVTWGFIVKPGYTK